MSTVFVLGAGASAHADIPLMRQFLSVAEDIFRGNSPPFTTPWKEFDLVLRGRAELQGVHSKAGFDLANIESIFAAFEMASLFGTLGKLEPEEVKELVPAMTTVIVETIERRMLFNFDPQRGILPTADYEAFASLLRVLSDRGDGVSVISFNYDLGMDFALWWHGFAVDYGFQSGRTESPITFRDESPAEIELLKLHGSLNWTTCSLCRRAVVRHITDVVSAGLDQVPQAKGLPHSVVFRPTDGFEKLTHCQGAQCDSRPLIAPPTMNKGGYYEMLAPVWQRAARRLREADSIFVVGYSWPDTDQFFHYLYALGTVGPQILRRFWIVNPESKVVERFERMLGPQAKDHLNPVLKKFSDALDSIADELKVSGADRSENTRLRMTRPKAKHVNVGLTQLG